MMSVLQEIFLYASVKIAIDFPLHILSNSVAMYLEANPAFKFSFYFNPN